MSLSPQQIADLKEAYVLYDRAGKGQVPSDKLGELMRSCGANPSNKEIQELRNQVGASFNFNTFQDLMTKKINQMGKNFQQDLVAAFKVFDDTGSGHISVNDLKHVLKCIGEPLSNDELAKLLLIGDPDRTGQVRYADLAKEINPFRG